MPFKDKEKLKIWNKAYQEKRKISKKKVISSEEIKEKEEKSKKVKQEYYQKNKDYIRERRRESKRKWQIENPENAKIASKKYYNKNQELKIQETQKWRKKNAHNMKSIKRKWHLKGLYNLTIEEYDILLEKQNNACFGCKKHYSEFAKALSVDHNHDTGKVRGLLCNNCNRGLGLLKDSEFVLQNLLEYLQNQSL